MSRKELTDQQRHAKNGMKLDDDFYDKNGRFIRPENRRQEKAKAKREARKIGLPESPDLYLEG